MEFDQILFKKILAFYHKRVKKTSPEELARTVNLQDITSRLTLIARALTGADIEITAAEEEGGWKIARERSRRRKRRDWTRYLSDA